MVLATSESVAPSTGAAVPVLVDGAKLVIARVAAVGIVSVTPAPPSSPALLEQWRTGARKVSITIPGKGAVVGSGPELGDWDKKKARPLPLTVELPESGVFEFKRIIDGDWEPGANQVLFVSPRK